MVNSSPSQATSPMAAVAELYSTDELGGGIAGDFNGRRRADHQRVRLEPAPSKKMRLRKTLRKSRSTPRGLNGTSPRRTVSGMVKLLTMPETVRRGEVPFSPLGVLRDFRNVFRNRIFCGI
jgi:hypothetical protein